MDSIVVKQKPNRFFFFFGKKRTKDIYTRIQLLLLWVFWTQITNKKKGLLAAWGINIGQICA